jgi:hypothetical protein
MKHERFGRSLIKVGEKLINVGYNIDVLGQERLSILNDPNIPALIYFNHATADDILVIIESLTKNLSTRVPDFFIPVSSHYQGPIISSIPYYGIGVRIGKNFFGWEMPPVVQSYRARADEEKREDQLVMTRNFLNRFRSKLNEERKPVVIIAPEGHRSETGSLLPAEAGTGMVTKLMKDNGLFVPIAISDFPSGKGMHYNPFSPQRFEIVIGDPLNYQQITDFGRELYQDNGLEFKEKPREIAHSLMAHLGQMLPEERRGYYAPPFLPRTLADDFELVEDKTGQVVVREKNK